MYAAMIVRAATVLQQPKDRDYGLRNFAAGDRDGNMIFFGMEIRKAP